LNYQLEDLRLLPTEVKQIARENQVPRGGHRQKLGQTFDNAEDQSLRKQLPVHQVSEKKKAARIAAFKF
jgi:hypothetical protein